MKKLLFSAAAVLAAITNVTAQDCGCVELSGALINRNLVNDSCYILKGCVTVPNGSVLHIEEGTVIYGDTTTDAEGALIIERGGQIFADGFPGNVGNPNPIIFTSINPPGSRNPGDWGGIIMAGRAPNNQPGGTFTVEGPCTPITAGGTISNDNSGVLRYVQIHYAGVDASSVPGGGNEINSLTLASVGSGTTIDHIQVTYANDDAFEWFGGNVNTKYLIAYNTRDDDFDTDFGFTGKSQFGIALRRDTSMHDVSGSNGIESDNNGSSPYAGFPKTRPIFSNYSIIGPLHCTNGPVNAEYRTGAHIRRNSAHSIYNSVITGWPQCGLLIDGDSTMNNTTTNALQFSYNTFGSNTVDTCHTPTPWKGCGTFMTSWLHNLLPTCTERGVEHEPSGITGIGAICNLRCNNGTNPVFTLGSTNMMAPTYTGVADLSDAFFDKTPNFRGAFGSTDWTVGWTNWCPQETNYCSQMGGRSSKADEKVNGLQLVPNPANNTTHAVFTANVTGKVTISILDKISGQALRTINAEVTNPGEQRIGFDVSGLQEGVYTVRVQSAERVQAQQLVVR